MSDLIKREDAIKAITYPHLDNLTKEERIAHINAIPSVDRPTGKWISNNNSLWDCSKCGLRALTEKGDYCLSLCGAKMKGADDETD